MSLISVKVKYLLFSLVASLLFHCFIFNAFVFTFPVDPQGHKPEFVFLGSILDEDDVVSSKLDHKVPSPDFLTGESIRQRDKIKNFSYESKDMVKSPFVGYMAKKPTVKKLGDTGEKAVIKPIFETSGQATQSQGVIEDVSEIDYSPVPYRPLRLLRK